MPWGSTYKVTLTIKDDQPGRARSMVRSQVSKFMREAWRNEGGGLDVPDDLHLLGIEVAEVVE